MDYNLYLIWIPGVRGSWAVLNDESCPDREAFSPWMYREYSFSPEHMETIFKKLISVREELDAKGIIPTKVTEREIFPELSDLLKQ